MSYYNDRQDAGRQLAAKLGRFKSQDAVVLTLPRGGVVLGAEVAKALKVPLGLVLVRKIGHPNYYEYAIGAIAEDEKPVYNQSEVTMLSKDWLDKAETTARQLIERRRRFYYGKDLIPTKVRGKIAILVDDGIATGLTMQAAVMAIKNQHPKRVVVAVPVASSDSIEILERMADEVVVLDNPNNFKGAVGAHYREFGQVSDNKVKEILLEINHGLRKTTAKT